jgi:formate-dependent nitrite reductase membrane component NrfD
MKTKLKTLFLQASVIVASLLTVEAGFVAHLLSYELTKDNPGIAYMQMPVLFLVFLALGCVFSALVAAFILLERIRHGKVFEVTSVKILRVIGMLVLATILPLIVIFFYINASTPGITNITNYWVVLGGFISLVLSIFIFLIATLFEEAVQYKQENDLTV